MQILLGTYLARRRKQWQIAPYTELRIRARADWYPIPDVCVYPLPEPEGRFPETLPLLWIEILSQDDPMVAVLQKAGDLNACGVPYVWIVDPNSLESWLVTAAGGLHQVPGKTLQIPGTPITIPLADVMEE